MEDKLNEPAVEAPAPQKKPRPESLSSATFKVDTNVGRLYAVVSFEAEAPFEVFIYIGKAGGELSPYIESIGRLVSISLRSGLPLDEVIEQLESAGGRYDPPTLPDAVSIVLRAVQKKVSPSQLIAARRSAVGQ